MVIKKKSMSFMFFGDFFRLLLDKYMLLIIGTIVSFIFSYVYTSKIMIKEYTATATIYMDKNPGPLPSILNEIINSENALLSAIDLLESNEELPQHFSPGEIRKTLSVDFNNNYSPYVKLSYANVDPAFSVKVINALADSAIEIGNQNPSFSPQSLSIDKYAEDSIYNGLSESLIWTLCSVLGFSLTTIVILAIYYFRGKIEFSSTIDEIGLRYFTIVKKQQDDNSTYSMIINNYESSFSSSTIGLVGIISLESEKMETQIIKNLSAAYASMGKKTLILDFNFDSPLLVDKNSPDNSTKYLDQYMLDGEKPKSIEMEKNIHFINSRKLKIYGHLFKNDCLNSLFNQLRDDYDHILIRMPSYDNRPANRAIIPFLDLTILSILMGETKVELIEKYVNDSSYKHETPLFGVLLPKKHMKKLVFRNNIVNGAKQ